MRAAEHLAGTRARPHRQSEVDQILRRQRAEARVVDVVIPEGRRVARQAALLQQKGHLLGALLVWSSHAARMLVVRPVARAAYNV